MPRHSPNKSDPPLAKCAAQGTDHHLPPNGFEGLQAFPYRMRLHLLLNLCLGITINVGDVEAVKQANRKIVQNLVQYYLDNPKTAGSIPESSSPGIDGFQWYESGIMWGAVLDYIQVSGDQQYLTVATQAVTLASHNGVGSFVGDPGLFGLDQTRTQIWDGKWNDDILWWALPALTGAEIFGPKQMMPGGVPYSQLAQRTYDEVWQQWDSKGCGGGIFWSRNRKDPERKDVKSSITNAQHAFMGARLYKITKDPKYLNNAKLVLDWMIHGMNIGTTRGIIEEDFSVNDGLEVLDRAPGCGKNPLKLAYKSGFTAAAFAAMFAATNDTQYITMANGIARKALQTFNFQGIITDSCEQVMQPQAKNPPENICQLNAVNSKGTMIRGLAYVYRYTNDRALQTEIRTALENTAKRVMNLCDSNWICNSEDWAANIQSSNRNLHAQINAMELFNALSTMNLAGTLHDFSAPTEAPYRSLIDRFQDIGVFWMIVVAVSLLVFVCLCVFCGIKGYRRYEARKLELREQSFWLDQKPIEPRFKTKGKSNGKALFQTSNPQRPQPRYDARRNNYQNDPSYYESENKVNKYLDTTRSQESDCLDYYDYSARNQSSRPNDNRPRYQRMN